MRLAAILAVSALLGVAGVCLFAGRQIVLLLDRVATASPDILPVGRYQFGVTNFTIAETTLDLFDTNDIPADIRSNFDADGRLTLHTQGKAISLGNRIGSARTDGVPEFPFAADDGDVVTFTRDRSLMAWPTPLAMNWMTGYSPSWRRNLYYRLRWQKQSGESLALVWRFEEGFNRENGWAPASSLGTSGLIEIAIVGATDGLVESIDQYLRRTKGWYAGDYRLEAAGSSVDGVYEVVRVIHRSDETGGQPGGGLSVEILLERKTHGIKRERGLQ